MYKVYYFQRDLENKKGKLSREKKGAVFRILASRYLPLNTAD